MNTLKFGVITDLHHSEGEIYLDRHFQQTIRKVKEAANIFNAENPDFVVNLGDTIDEGFENYAKIMECLQQIKPKIYHIIGNHDYDVEDHLKKEVPGKFGLKENYYHIQHKNVHLLFLDGSEISTFANVREDDNYHLAVVEMEKLNDENAPNGNFYNGGISLKQLNWFDQKLKAFETKNEISLAFCHFPIFPEDKHNLFNDKQVLKVISKYKNLKAWICGHNHAGNYGKVNNCHILNLKGLVETKTENSFAIFEMEDTKMNIRGFGREIDRVLKI